MCAYACVCVVAEAAGTRMCSTDVKWSPCMRVCQPYRISMPQLEAMLEPDDHSIINDDCFFNLDTTSQRYSD